MGLLYDYALQTLQRFSIPDRADPLSYYTQIGMTNNTQIELSLTISIDADVYVFWNPSLWKFMLKKIKYAFIVLYKNVNVSWNMGFLFHKSLNIFKNIILHRIKNTLNLNPTVSTRGSRIYYTVYIMADITWI